MRLFVGLDVPPISLEGLALGGPAAPAHLTVLFLGEVPDDRIPSLAERFLAAVRDRPAFDLELAGAGLFPGRDRPRVLWIGVREGAAELGRLHDDLVRASRELAISVDERPFVPHLTVLRLRSRRDVEFARDWSDRFEATVFGRGRAAELLLKESVLGSGPVRHRTIERLPLAGTPTA